MSPAILRDWSLSTGRGGGVYKTGRGGGASELLPQQKGGGAEKVGAMQKGGGAQQVLR